MAAIWPLTLWKLSTQEPQKGRIKWLSPFFLIKSLDPGHKCLNRWHVSNYPLVLQCNKLLVIVGNRLAHKVGTSLSTVFNIEILCWGVFTRVQYKLSNSLAIKLLKLHDLFEHNTDYLMSCPTGVLLLHALQQNVLQVFLPFAERCGFYMSGSMAMRTLQFMTSPHWVGWT